MTGLATTHAAAALALLGSGTPVAEALLVAVEGSAPLRPGATMYITLDGAIEGSVSGGCVEAAVAQEALELLGGGDGRPRLREYGISDELAGAAGLTCGGRVEVLIHRAPVAATSAWLAARAAGRAVAAATVLDGPGAGRRFVRGEEDDAPADLLGHSVARDLRGARGTAVRTYDGLGAAPVRVLFDAEGPRPRLPIVGATDFAAAIRPLAEAAGWAVAIADPRSAFARSARFGAVDVAAPGAWVAAQALGPGDALLVFSHDPKHDEPAIRAALGSEVGYVGALGSRRTAADRAARLLAGGVSEDQLARLHSPCGLDIGARTPEETAISVLAEILAVRSARSGAPLRETAFPIHPR